MVVQSCSDEKTVVIVVANLSLPVEGQPKNSFLVRSSREKTLACTRTWSADIPTQDSITNLFLIFYYVINIILSECTQSETPFHVAVVHSVGCVNVTMSANILLVNYDSSCL